MIFLDEPTTGLDPQVRLEIHSLIKELREQRTILLTTHYIQEAESLCDRVAIVDPGKSDRHRHAARNPGAQRRQIRHRNPPEKPMPRQHPEFAGSRRPGLSDDRPSSR